MNILEVYRSLAAQLKSDKAIADFALVKSRRRSLKLFNQPLDVVKFLNQMEIGEDRRRSAIVASLIASTQARQGESALMILIVAFFPALKAMQRKTWARGRMLYQDIPGLIMESFIDRVHEFNLRRLGSRAVINLIFGTRRIVLREITASIEDMKLEVLFIKQAPLKTPSAEMQWLELMRQDSLEVALSRLGVEEAKFAQEVCTLEVSLIDWVWSRNPELEPADLAREYDRIRRRRSRLIKKLKKLARAVPNAGKFSTT